MENGLAGLIRRGRQLPATLRLKVLGFALLKLRQTLAGMGRLAWIPRSIDGEAAPGLIVVDALQPVAGLRNFGAGPRCWGRRVSIEHSMAPGLIEGHGWGHEHTPGAGIALGALTQDRDRSGLPDLPVGAYGDVLGKQQDGCIDRLVPKEATDQRLRPAGFGQCRCDGRKRQRGVGVVELGRRRDRHRYSAHPDHADADPVGPAQPERRRAAIAGRCQGVFTVNLQIGAGRNAHGIMAIMRLAREREGVALLSRERLLDVHDDPRRVLPAP